MRILLSGASGLVGTALRKGLTQPGMEVVSLVRRAPSAGENSLQWDPYAVQPVKDEAALEGLDAAVHLSGENLSEGRWTPARKARFRSSRLVPTQQLARLLAQRALRPKVLVCASAIGIYGCRGDAVLTEESTPAAGFLPDLCREWEAATAEAEQAGIRVVHLRFGVILSPYGGALAKMLPVFKMGLGGPLGSGQQWMSWISLPDVVRMVQFALEKEDLCGAVNAVAPAPVTNAEFTRTMGRVLHRPALLPVPAFVLKLAFGEMADATILCSMRVLPVCLQEAGFRFEHAELETALRAVLPN
ncbi:MAG: TIGR01777 family oxidoreductase [Acidobacteriaceae bacterium]